MTAIQCPGGCLVDDPKWRGKVIGFKLEAYKELAKIQEEKDKETEKLRHQETPTQKRMRHATM